MNVEELLNQGGGEEEVEEGAPAWMATFADMSTLLLTFFVLLLSFANMDAQKFREMLGSVKDAFGVQKETWGDYMARSTDPLSIDTGGSEGDDSQEAAQPAPSAQQLLSVVEALFQDLGGMAEVGVDEQGVTVRVQGKLLFPSGSAELKPEAAAVLSRVSALLRKYNLDLHILGHTDSVPIETARFPSNWELSSARAAAALRYLVDRGADPRRLIAVGFADSRPLDTNTTPEGRARNRRVEFLFRTPETDGTGGYRPARP
ncbi:MAG: flagellar motor protein MotB [Deferrisomatales bacterium]